MKVRKKILFYVERNLHLPFLEPVHDFIQQHYPEVDTCFSAPSYEPSMDGKSGYGIDNVTIQRLSEKSHFIHDIDRYKPEITVVADIGAAYKLRDCGSIVNVGHGLTSKGCFFTTRPTIRRENLADLICVPGKLHEQILLKNVFVPVKVTGFITSDYLYSNRRDLRAEFCRLHGIDQNKINILYAPTYNDELSAIPVLRKTIFQLADSRHHLIIKLHGMTDRYWVDMLKAKAAVNPDATFISTGDLAPCLAAADLLISDVSSAYVEFMLLDKPIILVDNPRKSEIVHNLEDIEYKLRDACTVVNNLEQLKTEVNKNLSSPDIHSAKRRFYSQQICFRQDGKAVKRTGEAIYNHLNDNFPTPFSILIFWEYPPSRIELIKLYSRMKSTTQGLSVEMIMVGPKPDDYDPGIFCKEWIDCQSPDSLSLDKAVYMAGNNYIAFIKPDLHFIQGWLKHLYLHFKWNKNAGLVQALTLDNGYKFVLSNFFPEFTPPSLAETSFLFNRFLIGSSVRSEVIDSPCFMVKKSSYQPTKYNEIPQSFNDRLKTLAEDLKNKNQLILTCHDTFVYPLTSLENNSFN